LEWEAFVNTAMQVNQKSEEWKYLLLGTIINLAY
jgi:hypothetical protein